MKLISWKMCRNFRYGYVSSHVILVTMDDLLVKSRLLPLESRRLQFSLCHLFKILRGLTDFEDAPFQMKVNSYNTRSSSKPMLSLPQVTTNYYQHSFFPNIITIWNSLPGEATNCNSILSFKKHVISFLECKC